MLRHWLWRNLLQVVAGILLVAAASWLMTYAADRKKEADVPPGWLMIRSPGNLHTVIRYNGEIWAGGVNGLFRFDAAAAASLPLPQGAGSIAVVHDLLVDRSGRLWVGHEQGASLYNGSGWEPYLSLPEKKQQPVTALLQDRDGAVWMGLSRGVYCSGDGQGQFFPLNMGHVDVLYQDAQGRIWAGSSDPRQGGLACFDGSRWQAYGTKDGLVHPSVTTVMETRDGTLWIGTGFGHVGGANYFAADGAAGSMTRKDGLAGDKVRQIYEDKAGYIWFCSENDGVAVFKDGKRVALLTTASGLAGQEVKKIIQDDSGVYWLATEQGLSRIATLF